MEIVPQAIPEVLLLKPKVFGDERGFFVETARQSLLDEAGIPPLLQHNQSRSRCGVLRGLHYQLVQPQGKLVRCCRGRVFDVVVDVRRGSPSFGQWVGTILDDVHHHQLWVPPGFAHGFLVLSEVADFCYLCSNYYHPASEQGIAWDDPDLAIAWPELPAGVELQLSAKDRANPTLAGQQAERLPGLCPTSPATAPVMLRIPVSVGELVDKLTILELKVRHLRGEALDHAEQEHQLLEQVLGSLAGRVPGDLHEQLRLVNTELWGVEDAIRDCERRGDVGSTFIELARSVYRLNDRRAGIKRAINLTSGSALIEEKSYSNGSIEDDRDPWPS